MGERTDSGDERQAVQLWMVRGRRADSTDPLRLGGMGLNSREIGR
jgi:hypothetical protein